MLCPFCSESIPCEVVADIDDVAHYCDSACDMGVRVSAVCPNCRKVFWSQWVETAYLWQLKGCSKLATLLTDEELEGYHNRILPEIGEYEWDYVDGKLHLYLDIDALDGILEIVAS